MMYESIKVQLMVVDKVSILYGAIVVKLDNALLLIYAR